MTAAAGDGSPAEFCAARQIGQSVSDVGTNGPALEPRSASEMRLSPSSVQMTRSAVSADKPVPARAAAIIDGRTTWAATARIAMQAATRPPLLERWRLLLRTTDLPMFSQHSW